ncbi:hypothetical protein DR950_11500 [Kitasatospora xanthocidica]|uniref:Uncharacterized protein n=1 Tax=Kitasatospora xanthocidica TaxID=83382 RepID=A0A372ZSG4_9ACTN|nr:hypothetical protein [Kitasatospora xanthocidica]RGD58330.1 hypothetical protein DR950_11500 [Kitasatospora xanthocidica]
MNTSPVTRTLRAAVFAALVVLLAGLGQVLVTGRTLPVGPILLASAAVFAAAFALAGRERGFPTVAAVFLPLELAAGALFDLAQSTCPSLPPGSGHGLQPLLCGGGSLGGFLLGHGVSAQTGLLLLLLLHTVIALAGAFWLSRADAALCCLAGAVRMLGEFLHRHLPAAARWLRLLVAPLPARPPSRVPFPRASRVLVPAEDVVVRPAVRRGPPVFALAV